MTEENLEKFIEEVREVSYIPSDFWDANDKFVVDLEDIFDLIEKYRK